MSFQKTQEMPAYLNMYKICMHILYPIAEYTLIFDRCLGTELLAFIELIYSGEQSLRNCLKKQTNNIEYRII